MSANTHVICFDLGYWRVLGRLEIIFGYVRISITNDLIKMYLFH